MAGKDYRINAMNKKSRHVLIFILVIIQMCFITMPFKDSVSAGELSQSTDLEKNSIDKAAVKATVEKLQSFGTRQTWENQWAAAEWIEAQLLGFGLKVTIESYAHDGKNWPNVIAIIPGSQIPERIVMAMAHLDSYADNHHQMAPGADDNGSGVAALLEIARKVAQHTFNKTIILAFFSNEERGTQGSKAFLAQSVTRTSRIDAALNLDVLGYNNPSNVSLITLIGSHRTLKHKVKACYRLALNWTFHKFKGDDLLKVAGRKPNGNLATLVARNCETVEGLRVLKMIRDDCG